jgi:hypothetical protein
MSLSDQPRRPPGAPPGVPSTILARRSAARERALLVRRRRLTAGALFIGAAIALVLLLSGGGSRGRAPRTSSYAAAAVPAPARTQAVARTVASAAPSAAPRRPDPGALAQTHAFPSATSALFRSLMASLWAGIQGDSVRLALPAFFPRAAYVQLKAEGSPGSDWRYRLVHDYALDIGAAHRLLGSGASRAQLLAVRVVSSYGHWVPPGVCYNGVGYYEMPNARVVYRLDGHVRSLGIASMISWRGEWYVVHLGAVLREGETGIVDEPSSGDGTSAYSGTC